MRKLLAILLCLFVAVNASAQVKRKVLIAGGGGSSLDQLIASLAPTMDLNPEQGVATDSEGIRVTDLSSSLGGVTFTQGTDGLKPHLSLASSTENQVLDSENLEGSSITLSRLDLTSGAVTGPFGRSVYKMASNTTTGQHYFYEANVMRVYSGVKYRLGVVAKQAGRTDVRLLFFTASFPANNSVDFELDTGNNSGVNTGTDAVGMEDLGDGWYHCYIEVTASASNLLNGYAVQILPDSHTGNGTDGIYMAGHYIQTADMTAEYVQTSAMPKYGSTTGRRGVYFNAATKVMTSTATLDDVIDASAKTALVVVTPRDVSTAGGNIFSDSSLFFRFQSNSGSIRTQNYDSAYDTLDQSLSNGGTWVAVYHHDGTNQYVTSNVTTSTNASGATGGVAAALQLGHASSAFIGNLYRIVTWDKVLTASQRTQLFELAKRHYGVS